MSSQSIEQELLSPRQAAKWLGISERKLYGLTSDGEIPHIRLGRSVKYPISFLKQFIQQNVQGVTTNKVKTQPTKKD